jgi:hypothetical protein
MFAPLEIRISSDLSYTDDLPTPPRYIRYQVWGIVVTDKGYEQGQMRLG